jgi:acylphosphatase
MNTIARHLKIRGRVQGVGFRHFMLRGAHDLHITGWVRNCADGSVEAVVAGTPDAINSMLARAQRGPSHANVTEFEVTETDGSFERFEMRPTED